jgi:hypothetical protein
MRWVFGGTVLFAAFFAAALRVMDSIWPADPALAQTPPAVATPPLAPMTRTSFVIAPIAVANAAIRDAIEAAAPRDFAGRRDNILPDLLSKAELHWTMMRGKFDVTSRGDALAITSDVAGSVRLNGQVGGQVGSITRSLASIAGPEIGQAVHSIVGKPFEQRADMHGNIAVLARPALTPGWRIEPNFTTQVGVADFSLPVGGQTLNIGKDIKPTVDKAVATELAGYANRIRNDDTVALAARRGWEKLCRSVSLHSTAPGVPDLWLEMRPVRAFAAQPRIGAETLNLVLGVEAETRVIAHETQPDCPFPAELEIVQPPERGRAEIALAIDVPFTQISGLLEKQLVGKTFPDDGSGPVAATIESASIAGAGDRLLLALKVRGTGWFGVAAPADVYVWGRPALDQDNQILRLDDVTIDVQSEAALGLLGAAARTAIPHLQSMLAEKAVVDLKPFASNTRASLEAAIDDFTHEAQGVRVYTGVSSLRLTGIAFDATTLRLVAELDGALGIAVTALPK